MVQANGTKVIIEGVYDDIVNDLAQIVAAYVSSSELYDDDILVAIRDGIIAGMEERNDV